MDEHEARKIVAELKASDVRISRDTFGPAERVLRRCMLLPAGRVPAVPLAFREDDESPASSEMVFLTPRQDQAFRLLASLEPRRGQVLHELLRRGRSVRTQFKSELRDRLAPARERHLKPGSRGWRRAIAQATELHWSTYYWLRAGESTQVEGYLEAVLPGGRSVKLGPLEVATHRYDEFWSTEAWIDGKTGRRWRSSARDEMTMAYAPFTALTPLVLQEALLRHAVLLRGSGPLPRLVIDPCWSKLDDEAAALAAQVDADLLSRGAAATAADVDGQPAILGLAPEQIVNYEPYPTPGQRVSVGVMDPFRWATAIVVGSDADGQLRYQLDDGAEETCPYPDNPHLARLLELSDGRPATLSHLLGYEVLPSDHFDGDPAADDWGNASGE